MKDKLIIILDGGLVQHVTGTGIFVGMPVHIIDYDTDGGDPEEFTEIDQGDGETVDAFLRTEIVGRMTINPPIEGGVVPENPVVAARMAVEALALARDCLKAAGATRAVEKVRLALSSAKGAVRHVENKGSR